MSRANEPSCEAMNRSAGSGQWLATTMTLKTKKATSGCVMLCSAFISRGRRFRSSKLRGGVPSSNSAGAVSPMSRYWTMWMLTR